MRVVVYTTLLGPADDLVPPPASEATFICITDRADVPQGWTKRPVPPSADPQRMARSVKHTPGRWAQGAEVSVWMDASFDLRIDPMKLVEDALQTGALVVGFKHPDRRRITDEAAVIITARLAPEDRVRAQLAAYQADGFDTAADPQRVITTTGLLVRQHTPDVTAFQRRWRDELDRFTLRDQLSVDYCAKAVGLTLGYLPGSYRDNAYVTYQRDRHRARRSA